MIVNQAQAPLFEYMHTRMRLGWSDDFKAIALVPDFRRGQLMRPEHVVACVAYNGFNGRTCQMHSSIADPRRVTREFVRAMFAYPFDDCGLTTLIACVESTNTRALRLDKHVGFREVLRIPDGGLDEDLVVLAMRREDCRWINHAPRRLAA